MTKELAKMWGKVPDYIKFSVLNDFDNLKLEKQACVQRTFLKDCQKYIITTQKGKKMHHKQSSSVLKEIEKTTIVCKNHHKMI